MPEMLAQRLYMKSVELIIILEGRVEKLEAELHLMKTSGIAELAVRNPSVMEYMKHWEGRAEAAEAKLEKAENALFTLSHIHDGNPSDARADILPIDYARHMLWEARSIARTTIAELNKGRSDEKGQDDD